MELTLNTCIDDYIRQTATPLDKRTARHIRTIIPLTKHLEATTFNHFMDALLAYGTTDGFKNAFLKVAPRFVLKGKLITAELPAILTRIILNKSKFIKYLKQASNTPYHADQIESILALGENDLLIRRLLSSVNLTKHNVVFATFNEDNPAKDPFPGLKVKEIINLLALDEDVFESGGLLTAVKIRYRNLESFENRFPTFIDAGWWDKFYPAAETDDYGRTKCLDSSSRGRPEVVHQNARIADILDTFEVLEDTPWN